MLTTITTYWKRPEMLESWLNGVLSASVSGFQHLIFFVGEEPPAWWWQRTKGTLVWTNVLKEEEPGTSIGHYHNLGARICSTEWIMKMDVDTVPNEGLFEMLKEQILNAGPREWFNIGMFMANQHFSATLGGCPRPLPMSKWTDFLNNLSVNSASPDPVGTNFVCRRASYLALGGCDERFRGWGWEDYQQIFMLEAHEQQAYPLPAPVSISNVTHLCRDLSRVKALRAFQTHSALALVHRWHARNITNNQFSDANRLVLFNYINKWRLSLTNTRTS